MKILISLFILTFVCISVNSQEKSFVNNELKSGSNFNVAYIQPDSILTFQFTSENDSNIYQKQYNRINEQTQTAYYESWTWNSFNQNWSKYMAESVSNNNTEYITTFNWNNDSNKFLPTGQSENVILENYHGYIYRSYDNTQRTFVPQSKSEKWLTHFGKDSLYFEYIKNNVSGDLIYNRKTVSIYDTLQNVIQENKYNWENNAWILKTKYEFGYDTLGNQIQRDGFMLFLNEMLNSTRSIYTYDSLRNLINDRTMVYNNWEWTNATNNSCEFDDQNRKNFTLYQTWDTNFNQWQNVTKTEISFSEVELKSTFTTGVSTKTATFNWNTASQDWDPNSESISISDNFGFYAEWEGKAWSTASETWSSYYKYIYNRDNENAVLLDESYSTKSTENEDWNILSKTYYYYNGINVFQSINNTQLAKILVYPNPASNQVTILQQTQNNLDLTVFNLMGQVMFQSTFNNTSKTIDISQLKSGNYIFTFSDGLKSKSIKFLKLK